MGCRWFEEVGMQQLLPEGLRLFVEGVGLLQIIYSIVNVVLAEVQPSQLLEERRLLGVHSQSSD